MKLVTDDEVILGSSSTGSVKKFQITASAKAFKILSSGLYKNKIRAIIRELSCNALDAHRLNGNKDPFEIKVPSQLDPRFVIRDFGPGLNDENMMNLYTTYFASTKNNSNDFIGALGLGSKSPFSYTDTFNVVSYFNGEVRGYTAMLDGGEPVLRPIFVEKMKDGEKTGIEITVPVKSPDLSRWREEIAYVLRPFGNTPPVIKGSSLEVNYFPTDKPEWFGSNDYSEGNGLFAIYGNIVYPLDDVPGLKRSWMQLNYRSVYIHFPLGELDIAASREELSLDEETVSNILNRVNSINKKEMASDIEILSKIENPRELFRQLTAMSSDARNILYQNNVQFHGGVTFKTLQSRYANPEVFKDKLSFYLIDENPKIGKIKHNSWGYGRSSLSIGTKDIFGHQKNSIDILLDDKSSKRLQVVRAFHATPESEGLPRDRVVVIRENDPEEMQVLENIKKLFAGDKVNIFRVTDCEKYIKNVPVSSEPKEKRPFSNNVHSYKLGKDGTYDVENFRMTSDELKDLEGLVILQKRDVLHEFPSLKWIHNMDHTDLVQSCLKLGIKEFYIVRSTVVDRLIKYGNVSSLLDEITEKLIELIDIVDYDQYSGSPQTGSQMLYRVKNHQKLNFISRYFTRSGTTSPEAAKLQSVYNHLRYGKVSIAKNEGEEEHDLIKALNIIRSLEGLATETATDLVKKFEKENPVVYYVLSNCYSINDGIIDNINEILNTGAHAAP